MQDKLILDFENKFFGGMGNPKEVSEQFDELKTMEKKSNYNKPLTTYNTIKKNTKLADFEEEQKDISKDNKRKI